ncbi:hypothetical protein ACHAWF_014590 [Thalassiosira exigua]
MVEVAVIGAGASGLVAARHLLSAGLRPTIFEAARTVGGAWTPPSPSSSSSSPDPDEGDGLRGRAGDGGGGGVGRAGRGDGLRGRAGAGGGGVDGGGGGGRRAGRVRRHPAAKMWDGMTLNLSRHTCRFSDFPWPDDATAYPAAGEMHAYLEAYADRHLGGSRDDGGDEGGRGCKLRLESRVERVDRVGAGGAPGDGYEVEWTDLADGTRRRDEFGGVVVASGFFSRPRWPDFLKDRMSEGGGGDDDKGGSWPSNWPVTIHARDYTNHLDFKGRSVAVIGSSFSALEIASDVSRSAERVVSVVPSVPWVVPRWVPATMPSAPDANGGQGRAEDGPDVLTVLPADLAFYRRREPFPSSESTVPTADGNRERHAFLKSLLGDRQRRTPLGEPDDPDAPQAVAISDDYLDLVAEGEVEVVRGRLAGYDEDGGLRVTDGDEGDGPPCRVVGGVDRVICCTGYLPALQEFLSPDILAEIGYDPEDGFGPPSLAWEALCPSLPNLAFCGMYRGPYMFAMELQARLIAGSMSGTVEFAEDELRTALERSRAAREARPRAQFPRADYVGFMDGLAEVCFRDGTAPKLCTEVGDAVAPAFYQLDEGVAREGLEDLRREVRRGQDGSRMPALVMRSILGTWTYDRTIVHLGTGKMERVYGMVKYSKYWTRGGEKDEEDGGRDVGGRPVLYREDGVYEFTPTQKFDVFREYEYECRGDALEIYFVEGGKRAHLFLSLKFVPATEGNSSGDDGHWVEATSDHLCIKDLYSATFRVKLEGLSASEIVIKYRVKGPSKDYESTTVLKPQLSR